MAIKLTPAEARAINASWLQIELWHFTKLCDILPRDGDTVDEKIALGLVEEIRVGLQDALGEVLCTVLETDSLLMLPDDQLLDIRPKVLGICGAIVENMVNSAIDRIQPHLDFFPPDLALDLMSYSEEELNLKWEEYHLFGKQRLLAIMQLDFKSQPDWALASVIHRVRFVFSQMRDATSQLYSKGGGSDKKRVINLKRIKFNAPLLYQLKGKHLTYAQIAASVDCSEQSVEDDAMGRTKTPRPAKVRKYAEFFGVPFEDFWIDAD